jgi:TRAP-type uncharacterized transport system substrate-binding protein
MTFKYKSCLLLAVSSLLLLAACGKSSTSLRLVLPSSSQDAEIVANLAAILEANSGIRLEILDQPTAGEEALDLLLAGDADLALVSNYLPYREGVTTVMPVYPSVLHIAYRQGRDTSSALDLLSGANIFAGDKGSASRLIFHRVAERIGLTEDSYTFIDSAASLDPDGLDILILFAPISPDHRDELAGFQLYSLATPAEIGTGSVVDAAALLNPPLRPFIIPATTYGSSNAGPVVSVAVDKMLVARGDLDASVVYDLIDEISRLRPALSAPRPGLFETLEDNLDLQNSTFVLHTGTQDYLQRDEPSVYERYSGIAEVVVTLLIALVSASFAGIRILRIRRKNRIDTFYSAALQLRNRLAVATSADDMASAVRELRELQDEAFAQLVNEKLAADDSFRIFITLSNDILRRYANRSNKEAEQ